MTKVAYELDGSVATITMDDGKANALSPAMQVEFNRALERAGEDGARAVVLGGRPGRFSGGFDLETLGGGGPAAGTMLRGGFELAARVLSFPVPVVVACTGHAIAMGLFLVCSGDYRIGAQGAFRLQANEVAIGMPVPLPALAILRHRLTPSAYERAAILAEAFTPEAAVAAGLLDRVVEPDEVLPAARHFAQDTLSLDPASHSAVKRRMRADLLREMREGIRSDLGDG